MLKMQERGYSVESDSLNRIKGRKRFLLFLEFFGLFIVPPSLMYVWGPLPVLPLLWVFGFGCARVLIKDPRFDRADLWRASALAIGGRALLLRFVGCAAALFILVYSFAPRLLFSLPRQRPFLWLLIVLLYPLLSVYPQELIYRTYFFHRYRTLFYDKRSLAVLNVLLFGYAHVIFHNWIAVAFTVAGGTLFVVTYNRSRSTLLVSVEHSLFGCLLFSIGLGQFFYSGRFSHLFR